MQRDLMISKPIKQLSQVPKSIYPPDWTFVYTLNYKLGRQRE